MVKYIKIIIKYNLFYEAKTLTEVITSNCTLFFDEMWQANVGREKEFHASLQKFRGRDSDISEESAEIKVISSQHSFHLSDNVDHKIFN